MLDGALDPVIAAAPLPAPRPYRRALAGLRLVSAARSSMLAIFGEDAFEQLIIQGKRFGRRFLLVSDPAAVRRVMVENAAAYDRHVFAYRLARPLFGNGLLLADGGLWRRQRRMLSPAFTPGHVARLAPQFEAAADALLASLAGEGRVNLSRAFQRTAMDAALRAMFSLTIDDVGPRLIELSRRYGGASGRPNLFDALAQQESDFDWFNPGREGFRRAWMKEVSKVLASRRGRGAPEGAPRDLIDVMMAARDATTGEPIPESEIRDQVGTMIVSGFETTARSMFWLSYLLSRHPAEQALIHAELQADPPDRPGTGALRWPRLRRALMEAIRLYPPVPSWFRIARRADQLGDIEVEPGTSILISPWVMHRHRRLWDRPDAFLPERFEGREQEHLGRGGYIPFSAGPRTCIGASFAITEAMTVMARVLSRYRLHLDDERTITPVSIFTTYPDVEPWFRLEEL